MKRLLSLLAVAIVSITPAVAEDGYDCVKNDNDSERLACYDKLYKTQEIETKQYNKTNWKLFDTNSKLDDKNSYLILNISHEKTNNGNGIDGYGTISITCSKNVTKIIFSIGDNYIAKLNNSGDMIYSIDNEKGKLISMDVSQDKKSLGFLLGNKAIPFIKEMFGHEKMIVHMTPYNKNPTTMEFSISGIEEAIKPLREACQW